jgi:hypothetical protein
MVIDLDTEAGRIVVGLASIGAMVVGVHGHEEQANTEIPVAVLAFQSRFSHEAVLEALKPIVGYFLKLN